MSNALAGESKSCLEESSEEATARKAVVTGGQHREGPSGGCPGCINIAKMNLTPFERAKYVEAWENFHRRTMIDAVPLEIVTWFWSEAQRRKASEDRAKGEARGRPWINSDDSELG